MNGLLRFLEQAGGIGSKRSAKSLAKHRQSPRRQFLDVEELEGRIVPTLLGQQLFPADYPWNQNIANAPVAANSAAIISHIGSAIKVHPDWGQDSANNGNSPLYGIPFNVVHGNAAGVNKVSVIIDDYPTESDIVAVPMPGSVVIEGDYQNGPNPNGPGYGTNQRGDSHLLVWDVDNNIAYEFYGAARPSDPVTMAGGTTGAKWHAAQESVWNMATNSFRNLGDTSADAAGMSILAGLVRPDEGLPTAQGGQGAINHALRFTLPSGDVNPQYIYPASHVVSVSSASTHLPFGSRLRLMNTSAVNSVINTLGPQAQIIAHAMQQYGLVLADIGSAMYVTGTSASLDANNNINLTWNMSDVLGLSGLHAGDFEVVDLTPRVTGLSAATGTYGDTITITGQNFSGAAGHVSVLFGSVAATSVSYVDDAHLSVVVPPGAGIVNVQVQSGVVATDPNNPNDNATKPIFGYGKSATVAADQFTYQVIHPVSSGPSGTIASATPVFAWAAVPGVASYKIWLTDQTTGQIQVIPNLTGSTWTPAQPLTLGDSYTWWVGTVLGQTTTWGSSLDFKIAPTGQGPSGTIATNLPGFTWNTVTGAASYKIWLTDNTTSQTVVIPNLASTTWTPAQPLTLGDSYTWWVGAVLGQTTAWDSALSFRIAPTGQGPSGTIATNLPAFTWNTVTGAASYKIWLTDNTASQTVVIPNLTGTTWTPAQPLTLGVSYTWWVGAVLGQTTAWDSALSFRIAPTGQGPSNTIATNLPAFAWNTVIGAASYKIWLTDNTTSQTVVIPNLTGTTWTPAQPLTLGDNYTWWVGAVLGQSTAWDSALDFRIAPTATGPASTIVGNPPTFSWNMVAGAVSYKVWLTDQTTSLTVVISSLTATAWTSTNPLLLGHRYIWWVGAVTANGTVAWDSPLTFTVSG